VVKAKLQSYGIKAEFFLPMGHSGDLECTLENDKVVLNIAYGDHFLSSEARWKLDDDTYGIRGDVKSSVPTLNNLHVLASHAWKTPNDEWGIRTKTKVEKLNNILG
jgi:hypothetical protein